MSAIAWCRLSVVTGIVTIYTLPYQRTGRASPCEDGYVYIPVAFVVMLYLVYLVECWHCHTRLQLQCKVDVNTVYERIQAMREATPIVWWKAICYHYVRRTRQVTRYRNGDAFTTTQVYYERVNSQTASSCFNFASCGMKDVSKHLSCLEHYPATKIRFTKGFAFSAYDAEQEFEEQRTQFFRSYEHLDDYMETREGLDLMNVNFKEYIIAFADPDNLPWYVSQAVFWIASFLLLSWPLRVLIEYKTAYVHFHVHKMFGSNYPDSTPCPGQMTRVSTMESSELEMNIRNNYTIVPSYSEALLMESASGGDRSQNYGTVCPTNSNNLPLVHLGNSICISPSVNSPYVSGSIQTGSDQARPGSSQNVRSNGYVPLSERSTSGYNINNSSSDTLTGVQRRQRRRRRRKRRRRQSYTDAILGISDNEAFDGNCSADVRQAVGSPTPTNSTPESLSERDSLTLPSRESSMELVDSEGADLSSNGHDLFGVNDCQLLKLADKLDTEHKEGGVRPLGGLPKLAGRPLSTISAASPPEAPPAYELALAMRSAAVTASAAVSTCVSMAEPLTRRTNLPTTRSRVPTYQHEHTESTINETGTEPPIRLMETSL
ncbi:hypothetical protein LSH36_351g01008 [Paralvinella palmiformis]|uniref:Transmembrane protein 151B n=1 Tax=Paralvinella palmiformis TaxID=53620 RepID=A0AAD9JFN9_9ANNE|nr:hypothetical protein LSH36_351g01008 [Paralvinella palmiformis]